MLDCMTVKKIVCEYCDGQGVVNDWQRWCQIARRVDWLAGGWSWKDALAECRAIRNGWLGRLTGFRNHCVDCPACGGDGIHEVWS